VLIKDYYRFSDLNNYMKVVKGIKKPRNGFFLRAEEGSQFIVATHSPIRIYQIKEGIEQVNYEDTEHYQVMRSFLNNTQKMLNILLE